MYETFFWKHTGDKIQLHEVKPIQLGFLVFGHLSEHADQSLYDENMPFGSS
jgi:hypothetical protein